MGETAKASWYHLNMAGEVYGPMTLDELVEGVKKWDIFSVDKVWHERFQMTWSAAFVCDNYDYFNGIENRLDDLEWEGWD